MKKVNETFIFQHLNSSGRISNNIKEIMSRGKILTKSNMEQQFIQIDKSIRNTMKQRVLEMVESRNIVMMYSPDGVHMPTSMPWFIVNVKGNPVAVICIDMYGRMDKETGDVNIEYRKLFALLLGAYMGLKIQMNSKVVTSRPSVISQGSEIYSRMVLKCLNKKYALHLDKDKENKIKFLVSKFYMINILGLPDSETVNNYAKKNCRLPNNFVLDDLDAAFGTHNYNSFGNFMKALIEHESLRGILPNLTVRQFLEQFILMYDASMVLSLESFPYFIHNVLCVTLGAYMNNQYVLEDIMDGSGAKIFNDLALL